MLGEVFGCTVFLLCACVWIFSIILIPYFFAGIYQALSSVWCGLFCLQRYKITHLIRCPYTSVEFKTWKMKEWLLKLLCLCSTATEEAVCGTHLGHCSWWRPSDPGADQVYSVSLHAKYQLPAASFWRFWFKKRLKSFSYTK